MDSTRDNVNDNRCNIMVKKLSSFDFDFANSGATCCANDLDIFAREAPHTFKMIASQANQMSQGDMKMAATYFSKLLYNDQIFSQIRKRRRTEKNLIAGQRLANITMSRAFFITHHGPPDTIANLITPYGIVDISKPGIRDEADDPLVSYVYGGESEQCEINSHYLVVFRTAFPSDSLQRLNEGAHPGIYIKPAYAPAGALRYIQRQLTQSALLSGEAPISDDQLRLYGFHEQKADLRPQGVPVFLTSENECLQDYMVPAESDETEAHPVEGGLYVVSGQAALRAFERYNGDASKCYLPCLKQEYPAYFDEDSSGSPRLNQYDGEPHIALLYFECQEEYPTRDDLIEFVAESMPPSAWGLTIFDKYKN